MPKLVTVALILVIASLLGIQKSEAGELRKTSGAFLKLEVNKSTPSANVDVTTSVPISLTSRVPNLHLEIEGGRRFAIGTMSSPATSSSPSATQVYSLSYAGLPTYYKGTGRYIVEAINDKGAAETFKSDDFTVEIDREPPRVTSVRAVEDAFGARHIIVSVQDDLLKASYPIGHFKVTDMQNTKSLLASDPATVAAIGGDIRLTLVDSMVGALKVTIGKDNATDFTDNAGNSLNPITVVVSAGGQRITGPAVHFPPNVVAPKAPGHSDTNEIRPSSRVVTRVVRLYYYRNAERVAEIINRRTQQYNLAQSNARKSLAEQLGEKAEDATSERRNSERLAEQAAKKTREAEKELQNLQMDAEEAKATLRNLTAYPNDSYVVSDGSGSLVVLAPSQIPSGTDKTGLTTVSAFKGQLTGVVNKFDEQQAKVADLRAAEFEANNKAKRNEDLESRLIRSQFLKEVEAAETDPATYAPGDINSIDPVMQTSVSVIGEGVLQLRGPIGGINQIRRMIHQIDMPVGQVKVDIETVQINGEKGQELEKTVQLVEGYINVGRFLTNQSLVFLCRSVTEIAAEVAQENGEPWQRDQLGRDMRYLYGFFGQDFIDTLHRMDSEFLHSENQILSLHSMDAISRNRALLLIGLAKNSVRQRILERFQQYVNCTLPNMEYNYRTINRAIPCKYLPECAEECKESLLKVIHVGHKVEVIRYTPELACEDAAKNYQFLNFYNFFAQGVWHDASLNPVQREFIRLAQVFKSQLISEIELKQRIVERGLMDQKNSEDKDADQQSLLELRKKAVKQKNDLLLRNTEATSQVANTVVLAMSNMEQIRSNLNNYREQYQQVLAILIRAEHEQRALEDQEMEDALKSMERILEVARQIDSYLVRSKESIDLLNRIRTQLTPSSSFGKIAQALRNNKNSKGTPGALDQLRNHTDTKDELDSLQRDIQAFIESITHTNRYVERQYDQVLRELETFKTDWKPVFMIMQDLEPFIPVSSEQWRQRHQQATAAIREMVVGQIALKASQDFLDQNRLSLPQLKLLDHLIDEHEEKSMNLLEGTRSHISAIDNFLKRMTYALEDDFQIQFYDPALVCMRTASRQRRVTFSQVERTTVLGNNRELLKVLPQATMEFDLPNRKLRVTEAMQGAKALVDDYGALLNDPTFLAAFQMMGGGAPAESVRKILPGLPSDSNQKYHALPASQSGDRLGASLQGLVPDPEIYQIETGTGFEVRPVIQPDGDSMVYDLNYLYHTEMREPVRADEKHLGRIKRHLLHTQVQTSSFELREVGRYQVALKVARTAKGVPMLENAPVVGALFRPAPSAESSIQQNILLAKSVIYPTLYDLMGLSWAQHVAELSYDGIRNAGHVSRGRQEIIRSHVFDESSRNVDDFLRIKEDAPNYRPDVYREYSMPSPYHPNGYVYPKVRDEQDPTRRGFRVPEIRPEAYRTGSDIGVPAQEFDNKFRLPIPQENSSGMIEELPPGTSISVPPRSNSSSSMIRTPAVRESVEPYTGSARQRPVGQGTPAGFNAPSVRTPNGSPALGSPTPTASPAAPLQLNSLNQRQPNNVGSQQAVVPASATVVQPMMQTSSQSQPTTTISGQTAVRQPSLNARSNSGSRPNQAAAGSASSSGTNGVSNRSSQSTQFQRGIAQPALLPPAAIPVVPASYQFESLPPPPGQR